MGKSANWSIDMVVVFGGMTAKKEGLSDVAVLDVTNYTWLYPAVEGTGPGKRAFHCAAVIGMSMFVFGGHIMRQQKQTSFNDLWCLEAVSDALYK